MNKDTDPTGLRVIAQQEIELEELLKRVPTEHRGVLFERVLPNLHPQESTRRLELAYAEEWAEENDPRKHRPLLPSLLETHESDPRREFVPRTEREWQIACLVAATVIQFLPTSGGRSFQVSAFERGGGKLTYRLPETET